MIARHCTLVLFCAVTLVGACAEAQRLDPTTVWTEPTPARFDEVDGQIRSEIQRARQLLDQRQWDAAVESIRGLLDQHGSRLAALDPPAASFRRSAELRLVLQRLLCSLDGEAATARDLYRQRVDAAARDYFQKGVTLRDPDLLSRVVDDFFASRWGDNAAYALGEFALERGDYPLARSYWQMLVPAARERGTDDLEDLSAAPADAWPKYPDSEIAPAEIQARLILVSILEGSIGRATAELNRLRMAAPGAKGRFGGQTVVLADALTSLLAQAEVWPPPKPVSGWPTFAGTFARQPRISALGSIGIEPEWRIAADPVPDYDQAAAARIAAPRIPAGDTASSLCSYFPIATDEYLLMASSHSLRCYQLASGQPVSWADDTAGQIFAVANRQQGANRRRIFGVPRYTLSADGKRIYVVQGDATGYRIHADGTQMTTGRLVGLDLESEGRLLFPPARPPKSNLAFEGAPVVDGSDLYLCFRENGNVPALHVACLRGAEWRWIRRVAYGEPIGAGQVDRYRNLLLTLVGRTLYLNSHLGFVAALDTSGGRTRWITQYPRTARASSDPTQPSWHLLRDASPCVYHQGRVFVAPNDFAGVIAIDASDGTVLWQFSPSVQQFDAVHVLGVTEDELVVSGRRLWWINVSDGKLCRTVVSNPFPSSPRASLVGFGRGLVTDKEVIWPARNDEHRLFIFSSATGRMLRQPIALGAVNASAGNLLITRRLLIVAGPDELVAFRRIESRN